MEHICFEDFNALMYEYGGIEPIWDACLDGSIADEKLPKRVIDELMDRSKMKGLEKFLAYMKKSKIGMVNCYEKAYPRKLHYICNKPIVLFYMGNIEAVNNESAAIIGSRNCSDYGRKVAEMVSGELSRKGVNIVSGLAQRN